MKFTTLLFSLAFPAVFLFSQDEGAEPEYAPPAEHAVTAAELPEKIKAAFAKYLPAQKPENCKWSYTESEQQTEWNKKKKKYMKTQKVRSYATAFEPKCPLRANDANSPDISFRMNDHDKDPHVSAYLGENSPGLPPELLAKARELTNATSLNSVSVSYGPGGKMAELQFSFLDGLMMCGVKLNGAGKELEKAKCTKGAYGGME